jgi:hypothetical protein
MWIHSPFGKLSVHKVKYLQLICMKIVTGRETEGVGYDSGKGDCLRLLSETSLKRDRPPPRTDFWIRGQYPLVLFDGRDVLISVQLDAQNKQIEITSLLQSKVTYPAEIVSWRETLLCIHMRSQLHIRWLTN